MSRRITFRMVAYTDPAGKYNPEAPMYGNEDNFYVDVNLSDKESVHCVPDEVRTLNDCGLLMAVADGMGGMNAGEVASEIAIETVKEFFAPDKISKELAATHKSRQQYLEKVVIEADARIKKDAKQDLSHEGMGSTIILAWIVGNELTLTWCGDSRAYRFNPAVGIEMLSEDHSYVQELVKQGILKYEQTFDHPQNNIVTRSLGESGRRAQPETRCFTIYRNDIILLCSDGLTGVLRDKKAYDADGELYPEENLEDIIQANHASMQQCREALWEAAERADWYDNVTAILCEFKEGLDDYPEDKDHESGEDAQKSFWNKTYIRLTPKHLSLVLLCGIIACIGIVLFLFQAKKEPMEENSAPEKNSVARLIQEYRDSLNVIRIQKNIDSESYERYENRIGEMRELGDSLKVIALLDSLRNSVPDRSSENESKSIGNRDKRGDTDIAHPNQEMELPTPELELTPVIPPKTRQEEEKSEDTERDNDGKITNIKF